MSEGRGISNVPGQPAQIPGIPSNFLPIIFEQFSTLNTKPERPGIASEEMFWCDGFMPLGPNNLRVLPGIGAPIYGPIPANLTIVWFGFGNIADTPYCIVVLSDGSMKAINLVTTAVTAVLNPGGIASPGSVLGFTQWGSQYLLFSKDQPNGYWIWDAVNTYESGTFSPEIMLTNAGESYTSPPTVTVRTTGSGTGVTLNAQVNAGSVTQVLVTNPGSGFANGDFTNLAFTGGGSDNQALAHATLSAGGGVTAVVVTNPGSGYTFNTVITVTGGSGSGATFIANIVNGGISSVTVINPGSGYTSPPSPLATDPGYGSGANHIAGGTGAAGYATVGSNGLASITVDSGGSGYTSVPVVSIIGAGQNAAAVAAVTAGGVASITVTNPGSGYTVALIDINGGNNAANGTALIMPFGLSGTALETYVNRVWLTNGAAAATFPPKNRTIFSDAESVVNFDPSLGGGAFKSNDSFLRVGYHALRQTNGFLYLIGDSSLNSISGVQSSSSGTPPMTVTTFNNQNADPQIGSPWPSSPQQFKRNIMLANTLGIHISYGGAVEKLSDALDGFYASSPQIFAEGANFSSAVAQIFGRYVYMLLLPVVDLITSQTVNKLLMTDGKRWWTSQQDVPLIYIAGQELNSVLTAYGTDGRSIWPLFSQPSAAFTKTVQSKLWATPGYFTTKTALAALGMVKWYAVDQPLTFSADNETPSSATISIPPPPQPGLQVFGPVPIGQAGRLTGITLQTTASNAAILSLMLSEKVESPNL